MTKKAFHIEKVKHSGSGSAYWIVQDGFTYPTTAAGPYLTRFWAKRKLQKRSFIDGYKIEVIS